MHRYVSEFADRLNTRVMDTTGMMVAMSSNVAGKRPKYTQLIAPHNMAGRLIVV